jgi:anti-sigma B factor antagonist
MKAGRGIYVPTLSTDFDLREEQGPGGVPVVAVRGAIDLFTAPELKDGLLTVVERGATRIVLDLTETSFLDSSALAVLLSARKSLAGRAGQLAIAGLNPSLQTTFELTGLDRLFAITATREDAIAALGDAPPSMAP